MCGVIEPGLRDDLAALDVLALDAAQQQADVVAGLALVEQLAEHLDAGDGGLAASSRMPTISTSSLTLTTPRSTRPVTTVPRPVIVKTSSTGIRNGLSVSRTGSGIALVDGVHQLIDRLLDPLRVALERLERRARG